VQELRPGRYGSKNDMAHEVQNPGTRMVPLSHSWLMNGEFPKYGWLVVWNMNFIFPFSWECHHPN